MRKIHEIFAKNLRNICEIFTKHLRNICKIFAKKSQKIHKKLEFANFSKNFGEIFANFLRIFREFFASDHMKSLLVVTLKISLQQKSWNNFRLQTNSYSSNNKVIKKKWGHHLFSISGH